MAVVEGTNAGFVLVRPSADPDGDIASVQIDYNAIAGKFTAPAGSSAFTEIGVWIDTASEAAMMQVGIYADDAANACPELLLASSGDFAKGTDAGWKYAAVSYALVPGTVYWLGVEVDNVTTATNMNKSVTSSSGNFAVKNSQTSLPADWADTSDSTGTRAVAVYAIYTVGSMAVKAAAMRRRRS